ncbi:MAG: zinc ribbon-containing protein [Chloroflexota bacterium]
MKVEYRYAVLPENHEVTPRQRRVAVYYFSAGEKVPPGRYVCTFCGNAIHIATDRALPLCGVCDSAEYVWEGEAAA